MKVHNVCANLSIICIREQQPNYVYVFPKAAACSSCLLWTNSRNVVVYIEAHIKFYLEILQFESLKGQ